MQMAMKDGIIYVKDMDSVQFQIIKRWGKMKWNKRMQMLTGPADIELLNKLASIVNLPPRIVR